MRNRIFKTTFMVAILVWISCMILILGALYLQYNQEDELTMKHEAELVAHAVEQNGMDYFDGLELMENYRITWIKEDGEVLYDSKTNAKDMENHLKRPEVREALKDGVGEDVRYSETLAEKTVYRAQRLDDGTVIRVSKTQFSVLTLVATMMQPILVVLLIAIGLSLVLASSTAKHIVEPLNQIDLNAPERTKIYKEIRPLVDKIAEQHEELNRRISRLEVDVDEKTKEADFRREFTANVSHELKTPLTSISGFAEIIKNGFVKEEDIPRFAGRIYDEAQRLISLVVDILKLSQLDEKQVMAKKETLDLYTICEDIICYLERHAADMNVKVELKGEHVKLEAVEQILSEVVYNLCDNAIKYNKVGGKVVMTVGEKDGRPSLTVTDTGIGIPEEDLERIFERFFRVNKSHSKEIGGTGLGLSIVKHGAAFLGANITVESKLGVGTEITLTFDQNLRH